MRATIIGLTVLGVLAGGFLGMKWMGDAKKIDEAVQALNSLGLGESAEMKSLISEAKSQVTASYLLVAGALAAAAAGFVLVKKPEHTKVAAIVILAAALVPAVFAPKSLVFTFFLVIAGGLALAQKAKSPAATAYPQPVLA